jgi:hypothetical protein
MPSNENRELHQWILQADDGNQVDFEGVILADAVGFGSIEFHTEFKRLNSIYTSKNIPQINSQVTHR